MFTDEVHVDMRDKEPEQVDLVVIQLITQNICEWKFYNRRVTQLKRGEKGVSGRGGKLGS